MTDQDKRGYDALIVERVARALAFEAERMAVDAPADTQAGFEAMARAAIDAYDSTLLRERDALLSQLEKK